MGRASELMDTSGKGQEAEQRVKDRLVTWKAKSYFMLQTVTLCLACGSLHVIHKSKRNLRNLQLQLEMCPVPKLSLPRPFYAS
jgi:hypothetical protein